MTEQEARQQSKELMSVPNVAATLSGLPDEQVATALREVIDALRQELRTQA